MAGLTMITTYTATNPWWRTHIGRMMVIYASAEIGMSMILMLAVADHVGPRWFGPVWLPWFALQVIVGGCFVYQTIVIIRLYRLRRTTETRKAILDDHSDQR